MLTAELLRAVPDDQRVVTTTSVLDEHAADFSPLPPRRPDVVVYPETTQEVAKILALADARRVPVVPFGKGTSLEGHVIPVNGGISLDLGRMDRVLDLRPENLQATVQAGVSRSNLNNRANRQGVFFPVDPGADATLGGMAATNASGTTTVRYGSMRHQVLALEVVLPDGRIVRTGSRASKSSAGYDLTSLFVGSEGTLGVITELTVKLYGIPEYAAACRVTFASVESACLAALSLVAITQTLTRVELLDGWTIQAINRYKSTTYTELPTLFIELSGSPAAVKDDIASVSAVFDEHGGGEVVVETTAETRARLWQARHEAAYAVMATAPGKKSVSTDTCVPLSLLPAAVGLARAAVERLGIEASIAGHVGDGNYHVAFLVDPADPADMRRAELLTDALVRHALAHGGTCTGEHGIGLGKIRYLQLEHASAIPIMRGIKDLLDPHGIMNPGKVL